MPVPQAMRMCFIAVLLKRQIPGDSWRCDCEFVYGVARALRRKYNSTSAYFSRFSLVCVGVYLREPPPFAESCEDGKANVWGLMDRVRMSS